MSSALQPTANSNLVLAGRSGIAVARLVPGPLRQALLLPSGRRTLLAPICASHPVPLRSTACLSRCAAAAVSAPSRIASSRALLFSKQQAANAQRSVCTLATKGLSRKQAAELKPMADEIRAPKGVANSIAALFQQALDTAYPAMKGEPALIAPNNIAKVKADYQCNNAMSLFGKLKGQPDAPKAPRDVSNALLAALPPNDIIKATSVAGPGFINLELSPVWLADRVEDILKNGLKGYAPDLAGKRCIVDFSSPNVAKEMHVGHLRSTIIGDTLARTLEYCGADVLRLNHIGDWGTQFGMLIQHMSELRPDGLGAEGGRDEDVADLMQLYRASKQRFDAEEDFKTRAREMVTRLQSGEPAVTRAWERICEASRKEFQAIYDRLGVTLQERGESFYNPFLKGIVEELNEKGVSQLSDGATCVFVEGFQVPLIVQKSDGGFGYASTDMAAIKHRTHTEKGDWLIYVTDCGQEQHFKMVFAAAEKVGWTTGVEGRPAPRIDHVGFGLVLGEDGKKFKTRSGDVVRLVELLDEAKVRCREAITAKWTEDGKQIDEKELEHSSSVMGYGAVKYADLKSHRMTNYKFSYDAMLDLKGNTAVYLLYAYARIAGIVRKADKDIEGLIQSKKVQLDHPKEVALGLHLAKFPDALEDVLKELAPNRLTDYLYELSDKFNGFYTECKVLGSEQEDSRLLLVEATARVMRQSFSLLGLEPLDRI